MPQIVVDKNLIVGAPQGLDIQHTNDGHVVWALTHKDLKLLIRFDPDEATTIGVTMCHAAAFAIAGQMVPGGVPTVAEFQERMMREQGQQVPPGAPGQQPSPVGHPGAQLPPLVQPPR